MVSEQWSVVSGGGHRPLLSVIIPVFNEEPRIQNTLDQALAYLERFPHPLEKWIVAINGQWPATSDRPLTTDHRPLATDEPAAGHCWWELVLADDGSQDASRELIAPYAARYPNVRLLALPHRGKGSAVKQGMLAATGRFRLMCDADLSVPIEHVERLLDVASGGVDVALGSREAEGARRIGEPEGRRVMGRAYNLLARLLALPGLRDTQCGFKCYRGEAVPVLFGAQTLDGFGFDVEVLYLARKFGMTIREVGVDWRYRDHSKVRPVRDALRMGLDLLRMRWRHRNKVASG